MTDNKDGDRQRRLAERKPAKDNIATDDRNAAHGTSGKERVDAVVLSIAV